MTMTMRKTMTNNNNNNNNNNNIVKIKTFNFKDFYILNLDFQNNIFNHEF